MTTDIKNNLWVCHYGGACISVYNLRAKKIHKISLPAKNITNCTFGGLPKTKINKLITQSKQLCTSV
jgi:sugar lactone lactonase YvrE